MPEDPTETYRELIFGEYRVVYRHSVGTTMAQRTKRKATPEDLTAAMARFAELFRQWGREGGKKRATGMTPAERRESARKAARARWRSGRA